MNASLVRKHLYYVKLQSLLQSNQPKGQDKPGRGDKQVGWTGDGG